MQAVEPMYSDREADAGLLCQLPQGGQTCGCASCSEQEAQQQLILPIDLPMQAKTSAHTTPEGRWRKVRSTVLFVIACIASPCCTPLIVPVILALLAGTPAAVWLSQHIGWVYAGLTLLSAVSLGLGLYGLRQKSAIPAASAKRPEQTIDAMNAYPIAKN